MRKFVTMLIGVLVVLSPLAASAQAESHTVVHVVTVKWKAGTTPAHAGQEGSSRSVMASKPEVKR